MSDKSITEQVHEILQDQLGIDSGQITPTARIHFDLGADSLDQVELLMAFEEEFDIEISDEDAEKLSTVQEVIDYVTKTKP